MKPNSWKSMFNQSYGIKFIAAALGLVLLSVFTAYAVPAMAGGQGGETTVTMAGVSSGSDSTPGSETESGWESQAVSYEDGSQGVDVPSHADDESFAQTVSANPPSEPDVIVSHATSDTVSHATSNYTVSGYVASDGGPMPPRDTPSAPEYTYLECFRPNGSTTSWQYTSNLEPWQFTGSRVPGGFIWMSDKQIRDEIDTLRLGRFYARPGGQDRSFDFDMFFEILGIVRRCKWQAFDGYYNVYALGGNEITVVGHNEVYTYLCFARDEQGKGIVWSAYDNKMAYLSEEDYTYISDMLARAK